MPLRSPVKKLGSLHDRNLLLDDIENWNPESPVSMSREGIKKELLPSRLAKSTLSKLSVLNGCISIFFNSRIYFNLVKPNFFLMVDYHYCLNLLFS